MSSAGDQPGLVRASDFGNGFLWGVASASYQVEGAVSEGGRGPSIWDTFSHTPGRTFNGDTGDVAVDHYHRYPEDVALMAELGVNSYRFSLSWSRLLPEGTGRVNQEGVDFYRALCKELLNHGIRPCTTLYHWDLPQALEDRGGWRNPESVDWFIEYAIAAKTALGDLIEMWATFNEPWCTAFLGHSAGEHAPGMTDPGASFVVVHHLMLAHHRAMAAMREVNPQPEDKLGIVLNLIPAWPARDAPEAREAAAGVDAVQNRLFLDAVFEGRYPDEVLGYMDRYGVSDLIDPSALAVAVEPVDFLGVNYYNVNHIDHVEGRDPMPAWPGPSGSLIVKPAGHLTEMGWGVEPEGLVWMLERVSRLYPDLPMYVMENGAAYPDPTPVDGVVHDPERLDYIRRHILAVREAVERGARVEGYFVWSLLDNFEWARGYEKRFGIVHVDYETLERTVKDSGHWYRRFLES